MTLASQLRKNWQDISGDPARLLSVVIRITALAFLIDDVLEFRLFIRDLRIFLPAPLIPALNSLPGWSDWLLSGFHIAGLIVLLWKPEYWPAALLVVLVTSFRVCEDILRLQPFILMYAFTMFMAALPKVDKAERLQAIRVMIAGVYLWAGLNKLNPGFYVQVFPWFIQPFWNYPKTHPFLNLFIFGLSFGVPVFEALIGIFLVFEKTRKLATYMAFVMLVTVLACLGPFGHNSAAIVWPWNIYLFLSEVILFLSPHAPCMTEVRRSWVAQAATGIFFFLPILGLFDALDAAPSFKLYSANVEKALIVLDSRERRDRLPGEVVAAIDLYEEETMPCPIAYQVAPEGTPIVPVYNWLLPANLSSYYPSDYDIKVGSRGLCGYLEYPESAVLKTARTGQFMLSSTQASEPLCPRAQPRTKN